MIVVKKWFGRLGNIIIQLSNVIHIALYYKHDVSFHVTHKFLNLKIIENYFNKTKNKKIITDKTNFFSQKNLPFPCEVFKTNNQIKNDLLKKAFLIKDFKKLDKNDVVIHVRSGDIFQANPHSNYVPPPLSYYVAHLNKHKYKKIIIVCQDNVNPVVNKLLKLYKNAEYNQNTLHKDIRIILGATNIISSIGTFVKSLLIFSNNIKNHYQCDQSKLKKYYLVMKPWVNSQKQRDYILTYKYE